MNKKIITFLCLLLCACAGKKNITSIDTLQPEFTAATDLEAGFLAPPDYAAPRVYWWWLEGNISKTGILSDLREMKNAGIRGAIVFDAGSSGYYKGGVPTYHNSVLPTPSGPGFMSDEWRRLFSYACRTADSLGVELSMSITSGWNDGGPWVTPEQASKKLVWSELRVSGQKTLSEKLPLPKGLLKTKDGEEYFRPVVTLALQLAEGSDSVKPLENFAIKAVHSINIPMTKNGLGYDWETFLKDEPSPEDDCHAYLDKVIDISDKVDADGNIRWDVPQGNYLIMRFGYTGTGIRVSTHSPGGGGLAIDYMSRASTQLQYSHTVSIVLDDLDKAGGRQALKYLHDDSWELGAANWTEEMLPSFREANGYSLLPFLPVIAGKIIQNREVSNRFLYDFRRTLADLIWKNHYVCFSELAKADGLMIHPEGGGPHPAPIDALKNAGVNDVPMGEFWIRAATHRVTPDRRFYVKQPASAAHIYGHRFVQAEGPTSIGPHWEEDFAYMKPTLDRVYCEGLNRLVIHTFTHSPKEAGLPGNEYFAGTHFNPNVTWWKQSPAFLAWNSRICFLLSQGLFVGDVCYYYGDNVPNQVPLKHLPDGLDAGYDYDVCNTDVILNRMTVRDGRICLPDGMSYAALVLPNRVAIVPEVLEKIRRLVADGATVVGQKPDTFVGLRNREKAVKQIQKTANLLWGKDGATGKHTYKKGTVYASTPVREALLEKGISPDFLYESARRDGNTLIDYIHRHTPEADIYYIVNRNERQEYIRASFRIQGKAPELWNPETGQTLTCSVYDTLDHRTRLPLTLEPFGSVFVVFRKPAGEHCTGIAHNGKSLFPELPADTSFIAPFIPLADGKLLFTQAGDYLLTASSGKQRKITVDTPARIPISSPWDVSFDPAWGAPANVRFDRLTLWNEHSDQGIRHYSGTAVYRNTFRLSAAEQQGKRAYLNLGEMYNLAEVYINGRAAGVWWQPPFLRDITEYLNDGDNELEVHVVNLWHNRLVGDAALPNDKRLTRTNVVKFSADMPLRPSGLAGPVELLYGSYTIVIQ